MTGRRWTWGLRVSMMALVAIALVGFVLMTLWNWLVPALFAGRVITYWQALGVLALSRILFGRLGRPRASMHWRYRMNERWNQMTPEERTAFMEGMKRSGRCGAPASGTPA